MEGGKIHVAYFKQCIHELLFQSFIFMPERNQEYTGMNPKPQGANLLFVAQGGRLLLKKGAPFRLENHVTQELQRIRIYIF